MYQMYPPHIYSCIKIRIHLLSLLFFLLSCLLCCKNFIHSNTPIPVRDTVNVTLTPVDWHTQIPAKAFKKSAPREWLSPVIKSPFPFDELIYSWNAALPEGEAFRLYLKVHFDGSDETSWLYAGFWGEVKDPVVGRKKPEFAQGVLDMDWLKLKTPARSFHFKVIDAGRRPLTVIPSLTIITTNNHPTLKLVRRFSKKTRAEEIPSCVLDIPLRRQVDSKGNPMKDRCQSAALASALEYFGKSVPLEDIVAYTHDPEYDYPGIWPRVIGAANQFGFEGYIHRFRDWSAVRQALAQNKVLLCSIRMNKGECKAPPYPSMGNHIVVLNGVTDDGRVVVTDSALGKSGRGYLCQWLQEDFEKVWMKNKGGIAMVICPPEGATPRLVQNLPPFPINREFITDNDH